KPGHAVAGALSQRCQRRHQAKWWQDQCNTEKCGQVRAICHDSPPISPDRSSRGVETLTAEHPPKGWVDESRVMVRMELCPHDPNDQGLIGWESIHCALG